MLSEMSPSRTATGTALLLAGAVLTAAAPSAWAHTGSSTVPAVSAVTPAPLAVAPSIAPRIELVAAARPAAVPLALALLALVIVALLLKAPRRVAASVFVVLLAIVAFETGVHAVHHLGDTHAASHCVVASVAPHLGGATEAPATGTPHLHVTADPVVVVDARVLAARPLSPSPGRAPPALAS
jgi:hypothetical protein